MYCINPECKQRDNPDHREYCQYCGTTLNIEGQYRLLHPLHRLPRVSQIEVFECDHRDTLKVMKVGPGRGKPREFLEREALILQMLDHPGIPRSRRADFFPFTPRQAIPLSCLVMEKIEGNTMEEWSEANGPAAQRQVLDWLYQIADILQVLHELEFIHCDVKPDNLILRPNGRLVLVDFGAGTFLSEGRNTTAMGTVRYMAPEQAEGTPTFQSDFFSLGRTMIRLATGVPLRTLSKDSYTGLLLWRDLAPQLDPPLADLLDQMASPKLGQRPPTVQALLMALDEIPGKVEGLQRRKMLRSRPAVALYGILLSLLGFALYQAGRQYLAGVYYRWGLQDQGYGLLESSQGNFRQSIQLDPNNAEVHDSLGLTCQQLGDNICAVREFHRAIDLEPTLWTAHYHLGNVFDDQKAYTLAEKEYRLAMQHSPEYTALPVNNLARLKNLARNYQEAAELANQGLTQTEDRLQQSSLYKNLGWAEFGMGNYKAAQQHLQQSIHHASDQADPFCLLAQVESALGNTAGAKRSWQSCLLLNSQNPEVQQWRNKVLDKLF